MVAYLNQVSGRMDTFTDNDFISVEVDDQNTSNLLTFTDLRPGTQYQFTIVAYTNVGPGPEAMVSMSTLPDGNHAI